MHAKLLQSCLNLVTQWTIACQAPLYVRFSRQEYGNGLPCFSPRDLPDPGTDPVTLISPALASEVLLLLLLLLLFYH